MAQPFLRRKPPGSDRWPNRRCPWLRQGPAAGNFPRNRNPEELAGVGLRKTRGLYWPGQDSGLVKAPVFPGNRAGHGNRTASIHRFPHEGNSLKLAFGDHSDRVSGPTLTWSVPGCHPALAWVPPSPPKCSEGVRSFPCPAGAPIQCPTFWPFDGCRGARISHPAGAAAHRA